MTLMDKRTHQPFREFASSPSWLREDQQILTPRDWKPSPHVVTGKTVLWILAWSLAGFFGTLLFIRAAFSIR